MIETFIFNCFQVLLGELDFYHFLLPGNRRFNDSRIVWKNHLGLSRTNLAWANKFAFYTRSQYSKDGRGSGYGPVVFLKSSQIFWFSLGDNSPETNCLRIPLEGDL